MKMNDRSSSSAENSESSAEDMDGLSYCFSSSDDSQLLDSSRDPCVKMGNMPNPLARTSMSPSPSSSESDDFSEGGLISISMLGKLILGLPLVYKMSSLWLEPGLLFVNSFLISISGDEPVECFEFRIDVNVWDRFKIPTFRRTTLEGRLWELRLEAERLMRMGGTSEPE